MTNDEIAEKLTLQLLSNEPAAMLLGLELLLQQERWYDYWQIYLTKLYEKAWDFIYYENENDNGVDYSSFYVFAKSQGSGLKIGCFEVWPTERECIDPDIVELNDNYFFSFHLGACTMRFYIFECHYEMNKVEYKHPLHDFKYNIRGGDSGYHNTLHLLVDGSFIHKDSKENHKIVIRMLQKSLKRMIHDKP